MRTLRACVRIALLLATVCAPSARAQAAPRGLAEIRETTRHGFWGALGVGAGGEAFDLRDGAGYTSTLYRPTFSLRLGGTLSQHLRLGGEALTWIDDEGDRIASLSSFLFIAQYYPVAARGLYFKGGVGLGRNAVNFDEGIGVGDTGFAGLLGAGWELKLGRRVYLTPTLDLIGHTYSSRGSGRYNERLVNFGLGILFQ